MAILRKTHHHCLCKDYRFIKHSYSFSSVQFRSVTQLCPTLCDPMDCRLPCPSPAPGAYSDSCPSSHWCHPTISSTVIPFFSCLQSFPASGSFPMSQLFRSGGQSIGASALASVLPMNIQELFPLWLTGLILLSKGLWRVFSTIVRRHQFCGLLYGPALTSIHDYWKNHSLD